MKRQDTTVHMIPVDQITVLNPRQRGKKKFKQIVANIAQIGLKKPITVALSQNGDGRTKYNLVCGQGRLEAYRELGETEIPAIIVEASKEDLMLMSLVENLARRQHTTVELAREIGNMRDRGYSFSDIACKTGLEVSYVKSCDREEWPFRGDFAGKNSLVYDATCAGDSCEESLFWRITKLTALGCMPGQLSFYPVRAEPVNHDSALSASPG